MRPLPCRQGPTAAAVLQSTSFVADPSTDELADDLSTIHEQLNLSYKHLQGGTHTSARTTKLRRAAMGAEGARKLLMEDGRTMRLWAARGLVINAEVCMLSELIKGQATRLKFNARDREYVR